MTTRQTQTFRVDDLKIDAVKVSQDHLVDGETVKQESIEVYLHGTTSPMIAWFGSPRAFAEHYSGSLKVNF